MFSGCLSFCPSVCMYKSGKLGNSRMHEENSFKQVGIIIMIFLWTDYILAFTGQKLLRPLENQIWAKIQLWSYNSIQMYQVATFVNEKDLFGQ